MKLQRWWLFVTVLLSLLLLALCRGGENSPQRNNKGNVQLKRDNLQLEKDRDTLMDEEDEEEENVVVTEAVKEEETTLPPKDMTYPDYECEPGVYRFTATDFRMYRKWHLGDVLLEVPIVLGFYIAVREPRHCLGPANVLQMILLPHSSKVLEHVIKPGGLFIGMQKLWFARDLRPYRATGDEANETICLMAIDHLNGRPVCDVTLKFPPDAHNGAVLRASGSVRYGDCSLEMRLTCDPKGTERGPEHKPKRRAPVSKHLLGGPGWSPA